MKSECHKVFVNLVLPEQTKEGAISFKSEISARSNEFLFRVLLTDGERHIGNILEDPRIRTMHELMLVSSLR